MDKLFVNFLPPWVETNIQPAFYDKESGSVLQQTARMYAKVQCLVRMFNKLSKETKETVDEYIAKFVELKDFVDTYFENLDVQEEINNKLDEMAEDGTLQEIIVDYVQNQMIDNVEFLFNPQIDFNDSYYTVTSDLTPQSGKFYFVKSDNPLATNGYVTNSASSIGESFDPNITYYELTSHSDITGECLIIKIGDKNVMIDTGDTNRQEPILNYLQENNVSKIDYLIITHYHGDHTNNLAYFASHGIDFSECVAYLPLEAPSLSGQTYDTTIATIDTLNIEKVFPDEGDVLAIGNVNITFYNCGAIAFNEITSQYGARTRKVNDYSMVTLVNYFNTNVLYGADLEQVGEERLYNKHFFKDITIDLYKWNHHGVNELNNVYAPFIEEVAPKEVVIVTNYPAETNRDINFYNVDLLNFAYEKTLIWKSNGNVIKQEKNIFPIYNLKNRQICNNAMALNSIREFLYIRSANILKENSFLLRVSDNQSGKFNTILRIQYRIVGSPSTISGLSIETIDNKGDLCAQDMIYAAQDGDGIRLFFKKTSNNVTAVVSIIDETYEKTSCIIEPSYSSYTFSDFESTYPTYYFNPYFHELTLNGDYFKPYNDDNNFKLRWRKKNGFVEISGVLTTIESVPSTGATICSLPVEIAPRSLSGMIGQVQNANGVNRWFAQIEGSGDNFSLKFTRFGSGSAAASGTGIYIPVHMTYMSDK